MAGKRSYRGGLAIIDGSSYIFRAYYAIRGLSNSKGLPTNAIFGFTNMLIKTIKDLSPEYLVVTFDSKVPTFRADIYKEYKANRPPPPPDLEEQIKWIKKILEAFRIKVIEMPGYEADDIIATLIKKFKSKVSPIVIVAGDKDLMQLVDENVVMYDSMKDKIYDREGVKEKLGVFPEQVHDFLALSGDNIDNIPGIPGVGQKTAKDLLNRYGSIEGIYQHLDELKPKQREKFQQYRDLLEVSKRLVKLKDDLEIEDDLSQFKIPEPDRRKLREIFMELEFNKLLEELQLASDTEKESANIEYRTLFDIEEIKREFLKAKEKGELSFDLETTSLDPVTAEIVGISFAYEEGKAFYIPVGHHYIGVEKQPSVKDVLEVIKPFLEDPEVGKIGHNIKYDYSVIKKYGIEIDPIKHDTMIASYLLNPEKFSHKLDNLSLEYLGYRMIKYGEVAGKGKNEKNFSQVDIETATKYSAEDSDIALKLAHILEEKLKENNLWELYRKIELPLIKVLADMELRGVLIDVEHLKNLSRMFERELASLEEKIYAFAGEKFNINSPRQLGYILFEKLKMKMPGNKKIKKTKTGQYSTGEEILSELATKYELPKLILRYRTLSKLKSTYVDALPQMINPATGRIHTSFNQTVTATGRLSSSEPNLQNIPARDFEGREIRKAFIAPEGWKLLSSDYSQIELRIMAHLSGDEELKKAFLEGKDIHTETASRVFGVSPEEVTPDLRRRAKVINFGVIYGMTPHGLSKELGISHSEAKEYIDNYFRKFRGVREFIEKTVREAEERGYVTTIMGRRRYIPDIRSKNPVQRQLAVRTAINTPVQGSAADIIKLAMINIYNRLKETGLRAHMLIQIHDELLFEIEESDVEKAARMIREEMENVIELSVPLKVDIGIGKNWAEAH